MKVEIVQFCDGSYAVKRTSKRWFGFGSTFSYFDISSQKWRSVGDDGKVPYMSDCTTIELRKIQRAYVMTGFAGGYSVSEFLSISEFNEMNILATVDEGMQDVLNQAKAYYTLKKK